MEWQQILDSIQALGVIGLMTVALLGAYRRWYVFRAEFEDERTEKAEWKKLALELLATSHAAVSVAEKAVDK